MILQVNNLPAPVACTRKGTILYRVPEFLSSRLNWIPHPFPRNPQASVFPSGPNGGRHTRLGVGAQFRRMDRISGTLFSIIPLQFLSNKVQTAYIILVLFLKTQLL